MNRIKSTLISGMIISSLFAGGCVNQTLTPQQQETRLESNVKASGTIAVSIYIKSIKDPVKRQKAVALVQQVSNDIKTSLTLGVTLDQLKLVATQSLAKNGDADSIASAQLLVNSIFLLINNNVDVNVVFNTNDEKLAFQRTLVLDAISGVEDGLSPFSVKVITP